jgi:hypothetical protein
MEYLHAFGFLDSMEGTRVMEPGRWIKWTPAVKDTGLLDSCSMVG